MDARSNKSQSSAAKRSAPHTPPARLMSANDVADVLRTTPKQVRNMRSAAQIPAGRKIPGLGIRWTESEINQWIESQGQGGAAC